MKQKGILKLSMVLIMFAFIINLYVLPYVQIGKTSNFDTSI